ncbi:MAG: hypothetical protein ACI8UO_002587 [Verrucomicrobiales bacterium]|jgi:hypothetical protein
MTLILTEALKSQNLPLTILLGAVVVYWLIVILGAIGVDSLDFDVDADVDADVDPDLDTAGTGGGGIGMAVLRFLNFGQVPALIVISVLVLCLWSISILGNYIFNGGGLILITAAIFTANLFISAILTKITTAPLKRLFVALNADGDTHEPIVGRACTIRSLKVTPDSGQAEVERDGATFLINVRATEDQESLIKGDEALVVSEDPETGFFSVRKSAAVEKLIQINQPNQIEPNE